MPDTRDIRTYLERLLDTGVERAQAAGDLPDVAIPANTVERPKDASNGDYASTLPLRLSSLVGQPPRAIAERLLRHLPADSAIDAPEIAGPGFINFRLANSFLQRQVEHVIEHGPAYANLAIGHGQRAQVEFVSANPTGPLHVGNGRGGAIGDALASALMAAGYDVEREYYVNNAGTQAEIFGATVYARYQELFGREARLPEGGYPGEYIRDIAAALKEQHGDTFLAKEGDPHDDAFDQAAIALMVDNIRETLRAFGVEYDRWYSERDLYAGGGAYETVMALLRERGHLAEREGALWFSSSELGEDKDNVVVRSDGRPTYYASDIAYHYDKFVRRGFSMVVDVWGADHHGHVSRLKTATKAVGGKSDDLRILLYQLVTLKRGGEVVRLSKRSGEIITLDELIEEVGADAARFFFLTRSPGAQMDFDLDLAVEESSENPVYYVQYAHARLASIIDRASEQGLTPEGGDVALLDKPHELALIREMMRLPDVIELVATTLEPQHLPHYAMSLATAFHSFNDAFKQAGDSSLKVITEDASLTRARLRLVLAAKIALGRVLGLMGVGAPDRM